MENICTKCPYFCVRPPTTEENVVHNFSSKQDTTEAMLKFLNQSPLNDCPHLRPQASDRAIIPQH